MLFEWNQAKNRANTEKHGISFDQAVAIWESPHLDVERIAYAVDGESRNATIGWIGTELFVAIWTGRAGTIRLISVRRARRREEEIFLKRISESE